MPKARSSQIHLEETSYYHCFGRCVRRAFLCGKDPLTNADYSHRKSWVQQRLAYLGSVFAIDICAYAVMSNHYHLVLKIDEKQADAWTMEEVIERWHRICAGDEFTQAFAKGETLPKHQLSYVQQLAKEWRKRLKDISWFMRHLNEYIARKANKEDKCTGRFWESRFKSQALLDDDALLSCMVYVDLNPIRAGLCDSLEGSDFTSIKQRIQAWKQERMSKHAVPLADLSKHFAAYRAGETGRATEDYIRLVEWSGRQVAMGKKGKIGDDVPRLILGRTLSAEEFMSQATDFERVFSSFAGAAERLRAFCENCGLPWVHGVGKRAAPS